MQETVKQKKKGHGCFFYGCMTMIVIAILAAIGIWIVVAKVKNLANNFTSAKPADFAVVELPPAQMTALHERMQSFQQAMQTDNSSSLVLSADEINALLKSSKELGEIGGMANVRIEGDKIKAAVSLPTDAFGLKGRYFNGQAVIRVGLQSGRLLIFIDQLAVNGKPIPDVFMKELRSKNMAEDAMKNPDTIATIAKLKSISVQNGAIVVEK